MKLWIGWVFASLATFPCVAHETNGGPRTALQAIEERTNAVIVKGIAEVGFVDGERGAILIMAKESTDSAAGHKVLGVAVVVRGREKTQDTSLVDRDELDSLVRGIDQLLTPQWAHTSMQQYEAVYVTRDGLRVSALSNKPAGTVEALVQSSHAFQATALLTSAQLTQLRQMLDQARGKLDAIQK